MTSDDIPRDELLARIEQGLDLLFATEIAQEILENVDVDALLAGAPFDEAVQYEAVAETLGRAAGRGLVRRALGDPAEGNFAAVQAGQVVLGRLTGAAVRELLHRTDPDELLDGLASLSPPEGSDRGGGDDGEGGGGVSIPIDDE